MDGHLYGTDEANDMTTIAGDESDNLSDIDDVEVHFMFSDFLKISLILRANCYVAYLTYRLLLCFCW